MANFTATAREQVRSDPYYHAQAALGSVPDLPFSIEFDVTRSIRERTQSPQSVIPVPPFAVGPRFELEVVALATNDPSSCVVELSARGMGATSGARVFQRRIIPTTAGDEWQVFRGRVPGPTLIVSVRSYDAALAAGAGVDLQLVLSVWSV